MTPLHYDLREIEKAVRNIAQGKNAENLVVGQIQARIVKTLMEEGVLPMELLARGLVHNLETIRKKEGEKLEREKENKR